MPETIDLTTEPLPRNANGKVMKRQLREAWAAAQIRPGEGKGRSWRTPPAWALGGLPRPPGYQR